MAHPATATQASTADRGTDAAPQAAGDPDVSPRRYILYFDFSQLQLDGRARAVEEAKRWVNSMEPVDEAMVVAYATAAGLRKLSDRFIANREARHKFALQTCNGCHFTETGTDSPPQTFFHIAPANLGAPATLSGFMTGIDVPDAIDGMPTRHFNEPSARPSATRCPRGPSAKTVPSFTAGVEIGPSSEPSCPAYFGPSS